MNVGLQKFKKIASRILLGRWLMLAAIIIVFTGCAQMSSVGGRYSQPVIKKKVKQSKEKSKDPKIVKDIEEFGNKIQTRNDAKPIENDEAATVENQPVNETVNPTEGEQFAESIPRASRLPTLREQMMEMNQKQQVIDGKVDELQKDVKDIKQTLAKIQRDMANNNNSGNIASKKTVYRQPKKVVPKKPKKKAYVVLADEQVNKKNTPKKPEPKEEEVKEEKPEEEAVEEKENTEQKSSNDEEAFRQKMNFYKNRDYSNAIKGLKELTAQTVDASLKTRCHYWIGESYFGMKKYSEAIKYFNKVIASNGNKRDNALIMVAEANIRSGRIDDAKSAFRNLIDNYPKSEFVPRARKMLQQL